MDARTSLITFERRDGGVIRAVTDGEQAVRCAKRSAREDARSGASKH